MCKLTLVLIFALCAFGNISKAQEEEIECSDYDMNPDGCVGTDECSYCIAPGYKSGRCNVVKKLVKAGCPRNNIINFIETGVVVTPGKETDVPEPPIPFPLIPGTKRTLTITFELADHPVDVYYLMDFSGSMGDDKANVVALSGKLEAAVDKMASDNTLGFGSFVDKPFGSFGSTGDYSYRNDLALNKDKTGFVSKIDALPILSGFDGPESQVDAMFQSVSCTSQIGWRKHARHLLIVATDAGYHVAGDGLAAGIPSAFDGNCHLDSAGLYTEEVKLDYPSVDQLVEAFETHQVTPIFAVTSDVVPAYKSIGDRLKTSGTAVLSSDSSNIVDLLLAEYEKIDSRFEVETTPVTDEIGVKFYTSCSGSGSPAETTICNALAADRKVTFTMEVELKSCPADPKDWSQLLTVKPVGLPTGIDLGLSLLC